MLEQKSKKIVLNTKRSLCNKLKIHKLQLDMNMEQYPGEAQTAAYSIMPFKWTNWKSQFTEA